MEIYMEFLARTIRLKQWQACAMLLLSGYAVGALIAKLTTALGS